MNTLRRIVKGELAEEIPFNGGLKSAKRFVDFNYPFDPQIEFEFSEVKERNRNENTTRLIPNGREKRNPQL